MAAELFFQRANQLIVGVVGFWYPFGDCFWKTKGNQTPHQLQACSLTHEAKALLTCFGLRMHIASLVPQNAELATSGHSNLWQGPSPLPGAFLGCIGHADGAQTRERRACQAGHATQASATRMHSRNMCAKFMSALGVCQAKDHVKD